MKPWNKFFVRWLGAALVCFLSGNCWGQARPDAQAVAEPIHRAAASGNITSLSVLAETTNKLEARNELGLTPLQVAMEHGHLAAAALLVDKGANVNVRDPDGNTLLQRIFIQEQFTVQDHPSAGWLKKLRESPQKATYVKYLTVGQYEQGPNYILQGTSFLLACGVDVTATNHSGDSSLGLIAANKIGRGAFFFDEDQTNLFKMLRAAGANLDERDTNGNTALHRLTQPHDWDDTERLAALVSVGADVNVTNNLGETPLHEAAKKILSWPSSESGPDSLVMILVKAKANVNARDNDGRTPLHILAAADTSFKLEATKVLLDAGADPKARDKHGRTPMHMLFTGQWPWSGSGESLVPMIEKGGDMSLKDDQGQTVLHYVAGLGDESVLFHIHGLKDFLATAKLDLEARDNGMNTPLMIAAKTGTGDVYDWLVKHGANLDATNALGQTPRKVGSPKWR